jgi:hypothetical protein
VFRAKLYLNSATEDLKRFKRELMLSNSIVFKINNGPCHDFISTYDKN